MPLLFLSGPKAQTQGRQLSNLKRSMSRGVPGRDILNASYSFCWHTLMRDSCLRWRSAVLGILLAILPAASAAEQNSTTAQAPLATASASAGSTVEHAIDLAAKGHCQQAIPALKLAISRPPAKGTAEKELEYRAAMATAKCAMSLNQAQTAVNALFILQRDFPHDPEVLYITTHYFSELAMQASQELAREAPTSYQAQELQAESFESQGHWAEAAAEYQQILNQNPNAPGIHFRLGRVALSKGESEENSNEAKKEFEQELKLDPSNAAAEFSLGEIARRAGQWDNASAHFSAAARIDSGFAEAYLALGMSLASAQKFAEAVPPLEKYVKIVPDDPAGHYQLAIAYDRTGHKESAAREMQLQRETAAKAPPSATTAPQ
jgi:tetratricopeptide (TPR) repeat protein